jgi:hypothetical protein
VDEATNSRVHLSKEDPVKDLCNQNNIQKVVIHRKVNPQSLKSVIKKPLNTALNFGAP